MDNAAITGTSRNTHPMVIIAAIAVTLFSAVGIGALMGWIPTSPSSQNVALSTTAEASRLAEAKLLSGAIEPAKVPEPVKAVEPGKAVAQDKQVKKVVVAPKPDPSPRHTVTTATPAATPHTAPSVSAPAVMSGLPPVPADYVPPPVKVAAAAPPKALCHDCGVIESVREFEKKGEGSGIGAAAGGVLGGVLGHQVGAGRGRDVMTVLGAVGGAVAGHQVEKNAKKTMNYEITVRFEDGTSRTVQQTTPPAWRQGDKVRVINSEIVSNG